MSHLPLQPGFKDASGGPQRIRWADMGWRDYLRVGAGLFFLVLGIAGLVLPILQGVLFLIVSAIVLAPYSLWVQRQLARFEARFPWLAEKASRLAARWRRKKPAGQ